MRILLITLLALHCYADESVVLSSAVGTSLARSIIEDHIQNQNAAIESRIVPSINAVPLSALKSLTPVKSPFVIDYGKGVLSKKMEQWTLVLLEYPMVYNVVGALSDDILTSTRESKFDFTFDVNRRELRLSYAF